MASGQLNDAVVYNGLATRSGEWNKRKLKRADKLSVGVHDSILSHNCKNLRYSSNPSKMYSSIMRKRKHISSSIKGMTISDFSVRSPELEENIATQEENDMLNLREVYPDLMGIASKEEPEMIDKSRAQNIKKELIALSLPALAGKAIEPLAMLMETAYIGRLGPVQLASAGVSISIYNIVSKLFNIPLLSISTSLVAEDIAKNSGKSSNQGDNSEEANGNENGNGKAFNGIAERRQLASVSTALLLAVVIGSFEGLALYFGSGVFLNLMGISSASSMYVPAQQFLSLRAFGAPALVVSSALQGVFRGFKDTKTPVLCLGIGNVSAIFLFPVLMYHFKLGIAGAAIATVTSQYMVTILMIWHLNKRAILLPPRPGALQVGYFIKSGGFLLGRTLALLTTTTLATSMAARHGPIAMAAHQICWQVCLAVSLITDALASSGQALIASSVSKGDYRSVKDITYFILMFGCVMGITLAAILGISFGSIVTLFTKDVGVLGIARTGVWFVTAIQPLYALAFIVDGLHYGASDFPYAAYSMMVVGALSSAFLFYSPSAFGLHGVWSGLILFMGLRMVAGFIRLSNKNGPWWFLHEDLNRAKVALRGDLENNN